MNDDDGNNNALHAFTLLEHSSISRIMEKALNFETDKSEPYIYNLMDQKQQDFLISIKTHC